MVCQSRPIYNLGLSNHNYGNFQATKSSHRNTFNSGMHIVKFISKLCSLLCFRVKLPVTVWPGFTPSGTGNSNRVWHQCVEGEAGDVERTTNCWEPAKYASNHAPIPCINPTLVILKEKEKSISYSVIRWTVPEDLKVCKSESQLYVELQKQY